MNLSTSLLRASLAEMLGTGLLVFIGLGSVHAAVLTDAQQGVWQIAVVWGLGIAASIYCTAAVSGAHLNPAVTIAFAVWKKFPWSRVPSYILSQVAGAFFAAAVLFILFSQHLSLREARMQVVRGEPGSIVTAMCYGEYFPSPGRMDGTRPFSLKEHEALQQLVGIPQAFLAEAIGTMILVLVIFAVTDAKNSGAPGSNLAPVMIGMTVACLISIFAPLTQAGFNPARDFGPRFFSSLAGWGQIAWTLPGHASWFTVYLLAPCVGGVVGGGAYQTLIQLQKPSNQK
ncbi:MAG: aquaporin [Pirellulaceae bacterium]|nr:aquaporin [Pirellulaceae bacterium]